MSSPVDDFLAVVFWWVDTQNKTEHNHQPKPKHPKLPRTWGKEYLLLRHTKTFELLPKESKVMIRSHATVAISALLASFTTFILCLVGLPVFLLGIPVSLTLMFTILFLFEVTKTSTTCRPIYFQRLAKEKEKDRDGKMEAVKKQFPESKYRVASIQPPQDAEQVRTLLEADHPLSREQRAEAEALLNAEEETEDAQKNAQLAMTQAKPQPS